MTKADLTPAGTPALATADSSTIAVNPDSWWDEEADEVEGYDLLKEDALLQLVGVPFRIYRLTYRPGVQQKGHTWRNDYVTAELRVAPETRWDLKRVQSRRKSFSLDMTDYASPGEQLIVNDGSTGFYRQTVQYLEAKELIALPDDLPVEGGKNESRYDVPASMFVIPQSVSPAIVEVRFDPQGDQITAFHIGLRCSRGLRFSDYTSEYLPEGETARTWYIA